MTRRSAMLLPAIVFADDRTEVLDALSRLTTALSNGDTDAFLRRIPEDAPNRAKLADNIRGLLAQAEITSSVRVLSVEGSRAELDWYMEIRGRATQSILERRKQKVVFLLRNQSVFSLEPADFFRPAEIR